MKKLVLSLVILLAFHLGIMSQNFVPIPADSTSVWRISRSYFDGYCLQHYNSIYYINGTVIFEGKEYYKIYEEGSYYETSINPQYPCNGSYNYSGVYRGAIRTENGKTYGFEYGFYPSLLMDFTLNVGDTLYSSICIEGKVIESIDSVLVGDQYRKRFNFANSWYCGWMIEGIGHERGLFEPMDQPVENESDLICYGENGVPLFGDGNCDITVGQSEKKYYNDITIYPNPTYDKVKIKMPGMEINAYNVTDVFGRLILRDKIKMSTDETEIDLCKLEAGIYFLSLETNNTIVKVRKIIKR